MSGLRVLPPMLVLLTICSNALGQNASEWRPGDRPSGCFERSHDQISSNLSAMTKIAAALERRADFDEVGLIRSIDGSVELSASREGVAVEMSTNVQKRFLALFGKLASNDYTPSSFSKRPKAIVARPGDYFPRLMIANSGPWCGGTDEEWRAEAEKEFSAGVGRGGPMFYAYNATGISEQKPCSDDAFLTEESGFCELRLNRKWLLVFQYFNPQPEHQN